MNRALALIIIATLLAGCSSVCDREKMPHAGDASTPENLARIVQYACRNECWSTLYDVVSAKTRDKYSYVEFRVGFPRLEAPGREGEKVAALVARTGDVLVARSHLGPEFRLAYLTYKEGRDEKDLNVLLIEEKDDDGKPEWHVALQEQVDRKVAFE